MNKIIINRNGWAKHYFDRFRLSSGTGVTGCHTHVSTSGPAHYTIPTSCSCCAHHVNYLNLEERPHSQFGPADEGQNLYPEIYHICGGIGQSNNGMIFCIFTVAEQVR